MKILIDENIATIEREVYVPVDFIGNIRPNWSIRRFRHLAKSENLKIEFENGIQKHLQRWRPSHVEELHIFAGVPNEW